MAVHWDDAWCDQDETTELDWGDAMPVVTYGELVRKTDRVLSVAAETLDDSTKFRSVTHIPKGMVTKVVRL